MRLRSLSSMTMLICTAMLAIAAQAEAPYTNPNLSPIERATDLCSRLTLEEKSQIMRNGSPAIDRLGIPAFDWWSEALHGVGRNGLCTVFPSCIGMAASFDDDLIEEIFTAISDEARAKSTDARQRGKQGKYSGLSFWTPNINVFRDPRWGRGQETYGEDPYMNGRMGMRVVRGLQGDGTSRYYKLLACAKHYAVHSGPEGTRHSFNIEDLPQRDLWETYLPAFKQLITKGDVREVMCAYQRFEGKPCCGSDQLLQSILRDEWGFDGIVVSDCGAIDDFYKPNRHLVSADGAEASAMAVRAGTDVECGSVYRNLPEAVRRGEITEAEIDKSVIRLLAERFRVGDFDPDSLVVWTNIPLSVVSSDAHRELARKMGREQMVLLKNNGILPLKKDASNIMVIGPNAADSIMPWGIYYGQPAHTVTVLEGIEAKTGPVRYMKGCGITSLTEEESVMDRFIVPDGKPGLIAEYWNNTTSTGSPVTTVHYTSPISLDNGGNTAFEAGVNLTNFSNRLRGVYTAERDETLTISTGNDDELRIIINGDTVRNRFERNGVARNNHSLAVEKGKQYDLTLEYVQHEDGATLSFDVLRSIATTPEDIVAKAQDAETIIFVGGISPLLEREEKKISEPGFDNGDRTSIELPQAQRDILWALHDAGKKIVFVNCSGSAVALAQEDKICDAILQAWYPGEQGGHSVADVIFGDFNPEGKLPVTFYTGDAQLPPFDQYRMDGRTYRYMHEQPLYPFGYGLSYTTYSYGAPSYSDNKITVDVTNTGDVDGTEIVQVYIKRTADTKGPNKTLCGYQRVPLAAGETKTVEIALSDESYECWDNQTSTMRVMPGEYQLMVGPSSETSALQTITVCL